MARRSTTRFPIINLQPTWPPSGPTGTQSNGAAQSLRLVAELLAPVLALWPTQNPWPRTLAALGLITLELGFILNLKIGLFPFISIASLLILPAPSLLAQRRAPSPRAPPHRWRFISTGTADSAKRPACSGAS